MSANVNTTKSSRCEAEYDWSQSSAVGCQIFNKWLCCRNQCLSSRKLSEQQQRPPWLRLACHSKQAYRAGKRLHGVIWSITFSVSFINWRHAALQYCTASWGDISLFWPSLHFPSLLDWKITLLETSGLLLYRADVVETFSSVTCAIKEKKYHTSFLAKSQKLNMWQWCVLKFKNN